MSTAAGNGSAASANVGGGGSGGLRPARLPRWTRQEILVLIEGKRAVEVRGKARSAAAAAGITSAAVLEPKWAAVSAHCRRRGVDRGPVQCRKRWSNLAGDFKKIKEWEERRDGEADGGRESFWAMRNDARRERRLPGFFDREVFEVLDGGPVPVAIAVAAAAEEEVKVEEEEEEEEEAVFDSGRTAAEDGLFSDEEDKETEEEDEKAEGAAAAVEEEPAVAVTPISEKKYEAFHQEFSDSGMPKEKQPENPETGTLPSQGQKRKRTSQEGSGDESLQAKLIEVLEKNSRMLSAQLEAQNVNHQLEREQRKDQTNSLLGILSRVADALGRIADKL